MRTFTTLSAVLALLIAAPSYAADPDAKATFFSNIYASLCMRNINDFEVLRANLLKSHPRFPPEQAAHFLNGKEGDAWPVTSSLGEFVIALPKGMKLCAVYARRATQDDVERKFVDLVSVAPTPLQSEKRTDEKRNTDSNGEAHTIVFVWGLPTVKRKLMFALTTSAKEDAQIQAYATATVISE